jgi:hypothetical protein
MNSSGHKSCCTVQVEPTGLCHPGGLGCQENLVTV